MKSFRVVLKALLVSLVSFSCASVSQAMSEAPGTVIPTTFEVSLAKEWNPDFFIVGGGGAASTEYSATVQVDNDFYASQITLDPATLGTGLYQINDYAGQLNIVGEIFHFIVTAGNMDVNVFRFMRQHHFQVGDEIRTSLSFAGASIAGINSPQDQAFVRLRGNLIAENIIVSSVPGSRPLALGLAGVVFVLFVVKKQRNRADPKDS